MAYIKHKLHPGEKVVFLVKVHPIILLPAAVAFLATVVFLVWEMIAYRTASGLPEAALSLLLWASGLSFLAALVLGLPALAALLTTEMAVTTMRLIAKRGWMPAQIGGVALPTIEGLTAQRLDLFLTKVSRVTVEQDILGEMLNLGTLSISEFGGARWNFLAIKSPVATQMKINHIIDVLARTAA